MLSLQRLFLVLFVCFVSVSEGLEESCGFDQDEHKYFQVLESVSEMLEVGKVVGSFKTLGAKSITILSKQDYVSAVLDPETSAVTVTLLNPLTDLLTTTTVSTLEYEYMLNCTDGNEILGRSMLIDVLDENNIAPEFESSSYSSGVDWEEYIKNISETFNVTTSQPIYVCDGDHLPENSNVSINVSCDVGGKCDQYISVNLELDNTFDEDENQARMLRASEACLHKFLNPTTATGFRYRVQLGLLPGIPESFANRIWQINLNASDGVNFNLAKLNLTFLQQKLSPEDVEGTNPVAQGSSKRTTIIVSAVIGSSLLAALVAVGFFWRRVRKQRKDINRLTEAEIREFREGTQNAPITRDSLAINVPVLSRPYNSQFEIPRENLRIDETTTLGAGVFGTVFKGTVTINHDTIAAAVKTVKKDAGVLFFKALLTELKIMAFIGKHPNIVNLIGACTQNLRKREIFVAVELCENGNFRHYLKNKREFYEDLVNASGLLELRKNSMESIISGSTNRINLFDQSITTIDLIKWSHQIANGMEFIASKRVIHGDLAARNILLDSNRVCKIADFGLSRRLFDYSKKNYTLKSQSPLPWKYMAVESLKDLTFSLQTDVWTFGVLLWEIFTLGNNPFSIYTYDESFISKLEAGLRLEIPKFATKEISEIMTDCWTAAPNDRPSFFDIKRQLGEILQNTGDYATFVQFDDYPDQGYGSVRSTKSMWTSVNITQPPIIPNRPDADIMY